MLYYAIAVCIWYLSKNNFHYMVKHSMCIRLRPSLHTYCALLVSWSTCTQRHTIVC